MKMRVRLTLSPEAFRVDVPFARTTAEGHSWLDMMSVVLGYDIREHRRPTLSAAALRFRAMAEAEAERELRGAGVVGEVCHEYRTDPAELVSTGEAP